MHSLAFLVGSAGAMGYYAMWTGLGAQYKTIDATPRVVFWARYFTQACTQPVRMALAMTIWMEEEEDLNAAAWRVKRGRGLNALALTPLDTKWIIYSGRGNKGSTQTLVWPSAAVQIYCCPTAPTCNLVYSAT